MNLGLRFEHKAGTVKRSSTDDKMKVERKSFNPSARVTN